jgi:hypothetical protein
MSQIEALKRDIEGLSAEELAEFRAWFVEFDDNRWDQRIEMDSKAGRGLASLASKALEQHRRGESREL